MASRKEKMMTKMKGLLIPALYPLSRLVRMFYGKSLRNLVIRKGTTDEYALIKIFLKKEYDFPLKFKPKFIIDAGANVGYSARFFNIKYPWAKIIAIEPEDSNYEVLKRNTYEIPNILPIKAGLWFKIGHLDISNKNIGRKKDSFQTKEVKKNNESKIPAITINKILNDHNIKKIDLLKIDIEGSEKELFTEGYEKWIGKVRSIMIELHEDMRPGCEDAFYRAIRNQNFKIFKRGENIIAVRSEDY